jgi:hypothetical protein
MRINNNKLEIKYALELYKEVPGFPTQKDITYVMIRSLEDQNIIEQEFLAENIWNAMKTCVATISDLRKFLDQVSSATECGEIGVLLEKTKTSNKGDYYKLIRNPWM